MQREQTHFIFRKQWINDGTKVFQPEFYPKQFQQDGKVTKDHLIKQVLTINVTI